MRQLPVLLCVTRAYPPVVGGMEKLSYQFTTALSRKTSVHLIANRHGKKALPLFLPWAAIQLRRLAAHADLIHLGDPLLTVLLPVLPRPRKPVAVTIHGLDLLYSNVPYQTLLRRFLPRVNLAICISRFIAEECQKRFPGLPTTVVTPGIKTSSVILKTTRPDLERALGHQLGSGPLLLSVARLVPRKGIAWFVGHVLPAVPGAQFLVIGEGPERERIRAAARRSGTADRVTLAGSVTAETLRLAYGTADLFIMPNVPIPGDAEGFGLVALEAAAAGLPVLASDLEGLKDAVLPGKTGYLLPAQELSAWVEMITMLLADHERRARLCASARLTTQQEFSVERMSETATNAFKRLGAAAPRVLDNRPGGD